MLQEEELRTTIANCCGISLEECRPAASIYELGIDSIGLASLISHCEMQLEVELDDQVIVELMSAQTIGQIIGLLQSHIRN
jgi:acyl carrier protein